MAVCVCVSVCGLCASVCVSSFCLYAPSTVCVCVLLMMFEIVKQMQRHVPKIKTQQIREEVVEGGKWQWGEGSVLCSNNCKMSVACSRPRKQQQQHKPNGRQRA